MPRLIDAYDSFTLNDCNETGHSLAFGGGFIDVYGPDGKHICQFWAGDAPTIDPESLRPCGEWGTISINKENRTVFIECAECGATFTIPLFDFGLCYHYCPNCGAKMDEEEDDA